MVLPRRARRRIDIIVAAVIAVAVIVVTVVIYLGSDSRATTLTTAAPGAVPVVPDAPTEVPAALQEIWQLTTDARYGAVVTPYGTVATADEHTVRGYAADTGAPLWSYERSNRTLCALASGDTAPDKLSSWTGVHGIMTLYSKNGYCSQVTLLDPSTGDRLYQRTSPNPDPGQLFFGEPYVGWMGDDYLELWRHDLVATIRYGDQPNPVNASGPHVGCTFTDAAVTADQLATIEHCGKDTNLVLNWPTPSDAPDKDDKGWDANHSEPKATVPLATSAAVILGLTADRAAVLVSDPTPAIVIIDAAGKEVSRTPVDIDPSEVTRTAAAGITPSVVDQSRRYTLVGSSIFSFSSTSVTVPAPPPTDEPAETGATSDSTTSNSAATTTSAAPAAPTTVTEKSPVYDWMAPDALGLPTRIGTEVLMPTSGGLAVLDSSDGTVSHTIKVDRGAYDGRVDVRAVGAILVEVRGSAVVGLGATA